MGRLVYDANVVIALLDPANLYHDQALAIYLASSSSSIHVSALTYAEILTHPAGTNSLNKFVDNLSKAGLEVEPITAELAIEISKVRHSTRLKMPDASVLALAKSLGSELITADRQLATRSRELKVKVRLLS